MNPKNRLDRALTLALELEGDDLLCAEMLSLLKGRTVDLIVRKVAGGLPESLAELEEIKAENKEIKEKIKDVIRDLEWFACD